jgi:hypothetical protein
MAPHSHRPVLGLPAGCQYSRGDGAVTALAGTDDTCTQRDSVSEYQDLSFFKESANMTSPVLSAVSNQSMMDATRVRTFRDRYAAWQAQDPPARVADALVNAGVDTVRQIARLGRAYFKSRHLRPKTLRELASWAKERLTAADVIAEALSLSLPPDDARETVNAVIALRRNGFRPPALQTDAGTVMSNAMMVTASSADVQVVAAASRILVDVQTWLFDTAGQSRRDHASAGLSVSEARRLYVLLGKAIAIAAEAEPRQGRIQLPSGTHNWTQP